MNSTQSPSTTPPLTPDLASHPNTSQPNDGRLPTPPPPPARPTLADLNPPTTPTPDRTVLPNVSAPPDHHTGPRASFDSIGTQEVEELAEPVENLGKTYAELSRADIRKDPILSRLAKSQGKNIDSPYDSKVAPVSFKARPAPATTGRAAGPRLSKAAALRMGTWTPAPVPAPDPAQKEAKDTLRAGHKTRPSMVSGDFMRPIQPAECIEHCIPCCSARGSSPKSLGPFTYRQRDPDRIHRSQDGRAGPRREKSTCIGGKGEASTKRGDAY